jgi:hypothetical protein
MFKKIIFQTSLSMITFGSWSLFFLRISSRLGPSLVTNTFDGFPFGTGPEGGGGADILLVN